MAQEAGVVGKKNFSGPKKCFIGFRGLKQGSTGKTNQDRLKQAKASSILVWMPSTESG